MCVTTQATLSSLEGRWDANATAIRIINAVKHQFAEKGLHCSTGNRCSEFAEVNSKTKGSAAAATPGINSREDNAT